jgi:hypothetical protein
LGRLPETFVIVEIIHIRMQKARNEEKRPAPCHVAILKGLLS